MERRGQIWKQHESGRVIGTWWVRRKNLEDIGFRLRIQCFLLRWCKREDLRLLNWGRIVEISIVWNSKHLGFLALSSVNVSKTLFFYCPALSSLSFCLWLLWLYLIAVFFLPHLALLMLLSWFSSVCFLQPTPTETQQTHTYNRENKYWTNIFVKNSLTALWRGFVNASVLKNFLLIDNFVCVETRSNKPLLLWPIHRDLEIAILSGTD